MTSEKPTTDLILTDKETQDFIGASVNEVAMACHGLAAESGWWIDLETGEDVRTWEPKYFMCWVMSKITLMHSELSEGVEGYRKDLMDDKLRHRKMFEVELADAVIRIFDMAGGLNMDIGGAIVEKLVFNASRKDHKIENRKAENGKRI